MKLYFGDAGTALTSIMILGLLGFIGYTIWQGAEVSVWGWRNLFLAVYGLVICCFAAARDGLDRTIQHAIDGSVGPGVFPLLSLPNCIACFGALLILTAGLVALFTRSQHTAQLCFYWMSGGALLKIAAVETARLLQR